MLYIDRTVICMFLLQCRVNTICCLLHMLIHQGAMNKIKKILDDDSKHLGEAVGTSCYRLMIKDHQRDEL